MSRLRTIRWKRYLLIGLPLALILMVSGAGFWLLHTTSGASWLWSKVESASAGALHASRVGGDLASGMEIQNLRYHSDTMDVSVRRLDFEAGPGGWPLAIRVRSLTLQDAEIIVSADDPKEPRVEGETDIRSVLSDLKLPVPVEVHHAALTNVTLRQAAEAPVTVLESARFRATLDERLVIEQLDFLAMGIEAGLRGELSLAPPFNVFAALDGQYKTTLQDGMTEWMMPFALALSGNLDRLEFDFNSLEHGLQMGGELFNPVTEPEWIVKGGIEHLLCHPQKAQMR